MESLLSVMVAQSLLVAASHDGEMLHRIGITAVGRGGLLELVTVEVQVVDNRVFNLL